MEKVVVPSKAVLDEHKKYEEEIVLIEQWHRELLRLMLSHSFWVKDIDELKQDLVDEAGASSLHPFEVMRSWLNSYYAEKFYNKFRQSVM